MANNKIQLADGTVLLDLTSDTVDAAHLAEGYTAHNSAGEPIVGTMPGGGGGTSSQTGVVDTSASYTIIYTYFPDAVSVTIPTRVVTATSAAGELQT